MTNRNAAIAAAYDTLGMKSHESVSLGGRGGVAGREELTCMEEGDHPDQGRGGEGELALFPSLPLLEGDLAAQPATWDSRITNTPLKRENFGR